VTDKLWKKFYEKEFGTKNTEQVVERMRKSLKSFKWIQLYEVIFYIPFFFKLSFLIIFFVRRSFLF
jgi:hypothetical protein